MIPPTNPTGLLRPGEHVDVTLVAYHPQLRASIAGTIIGTDGYGILIERQSGGSVFIPWSSISTVTKVAT
jgi:hypothetical protein